MKGQGINKPNKPSQKVFVGMSGGVDSSVSAALLKQAGYDVTGVFIKVWQPDWIDCNWREERYEAMRVAAHIGIPFVTLDLEKEYKQGVIDYMISEYSAGRTPNPDVMCNREVKFGGFWKWAKEQGADFVATGHYAKIKKESFNKGTTEQFKMLVGKDKNKDQTYFLWTLNQSDLSHVLFPVGDMEKSEVRKLAKKYKLPNALKKDSQGLCFIGKIDVKDFLAHYIKTEPGKVLNEKGEEIGTHNGALFMTIGERHGFTIDPEFKTAHDMPYYVVSKDVHRNTIVVSNMVKNDKLKYKQEIEISKVNWTNNVPAIDDLIDIRVRYRQVLTPAKIQLIEGDTAIIIPEDEIDTVTSGQSLVMYKDGECLGGGIIN